MKWGKNIYIKNSYDINDNEMIKQIVVLAQATVAQ